MKYAKSKNLTPYDVLIIASMIEREAVVEKDRKLIAAVIYNRLSQGMPLQIDATIRFAENNWTKPLTESDLHISSPYNTYDEHGPAADADRQPGPGVDPGRGASRERQLPLLRGEAERLRPFLHRLLFRFPGGAGPLQLGPRCGRRQLADQLSVAARRRSGARVASPPMPKRLAVLGQPISHSRSPAMQTAALAELGLADEWSYEAIEVAPEDFDERVRAMPGEGFVGANVTVPHKLAALAIADEASEAARAIGAANTLSFATGGSPPRTPTRPASSTRCPSPRPAPARWCSARGLGAGRRVGARRRRRRRRDLEPHPEKAEGLAASSAPRRPKPSTRPISTCS